MLSSLPSRALPLKPQSVKVYTFGLWNLHLEQGFPDHYQIPSNFVAYSAASSNSKVVLKPSQEIHCQLHLAHYDHTILWVRHPSTILQLPLEQWASGTATQQGCTSETWAVPHKNQSLQDEPLFAWTHSQTDPSGDSTLCTAPNRLLAVSPSRPLAPLLFWKQDSFYSAQWHLNTLIRELTGCTWVCSQLCSSHSSGSGQPPQQQQQRASHKLTRHWRDTDNSEVAATLVRSWLWSQIRYSKSLVGPY